MADLAAPTDGYTSVSAMSLGITADTNVRDVSSLLDLWAHDQTPVLNRLSWGASSGGLKIEWISEHLGFGYVRTCAAIASDGANFVVSTGDFSSTTAEVAKPMQAGTLLYTHTTGDAVGSFMVVTTVDSDLTVTVTQLLGGSTETAAGSKLYIIGHMVNEGSDPFPDSTRKRTILTNPMAILRKDIKITGTMANTDMYAVGNELSHQVRLRLLEMQFERERTVLFSQIQAQSSSVAGLMYGAIGFLNSVVGSYSTQVDQTTTTLTESAVNTMAAACWEAGGRPNLLCGNVTNIRKFTTWDQARVRNSPDTKLGGHWTTKYMTDTGIELDLVPQPYAPPNVVFMLDTSKMTLRPKKNRKLIVEKLAKVGDYERYQLLSEFSLEMKGYDKGQHGMFSGLQI